MLNDDPTTSSTTRWWRGVRAMVARAAEPGAHRRGVGRGAGDGAGAAQGARDGAARAGVHAGDEANSDGGNSTVAQRWSWWRQHRARTAGGS